MAAGNWFFDIALGVRDLDGAMESCEHIRIRRDARSQSRISQNSAADFFL